MAGAAGEQAPKSVRAKGVVARGHTVVTEAGRKGPGDTVELQEDEIIELMSRGFLVDDTVDLSPEASGPSFERR